CAGEEDPAHLAVGELFSRALAETFQAEEIEGFFGGLAIGGGERVVEADAGVAAGGGDFFYGEVGGGDGLDVGSHEARALLERLQRHAWDDAGAADGAVAGDAVVAVQRAQ